MGKYFKPEEFRCPCCGAVKVSDTLVQTLDNIREIVGFPMKINSGYRCPKHNEEVGGGPEHPSGEAADVHCADSQKRFALANAALSASVRRIGIGKAFIHIGVSKDLPQSVIWTY
jgi:uncharacterized protein YcbK (DUF882 family)